MRHRENPEVSRAGGAYQKCVLVHFISRCLTPRYGANSPVGKKLIADLKVMIEDTYQKTGNKKVTLIAHR